MDARDELTRLTADFRRAVGHLARSGVFAAPGGPSPRADAAGGAAVAIACVANAGVAGDDGPAAGASLAQVRAWLGDCQRCKLAPLRKQIVFGVGAERAPLMFVGEGPGAEEDRRGEPFVGAAGQLLDKMIGAMGWTRASVYIANIVKCRPPGNRDPEADEVAACAPFLARQIEAVAPRVIVTLGRPASQSLLGTSAPISALRGRWHEHRGVRVMPTFHPAFLLRQPDRKRDAWSDLKLVIDELARLGVELPAGAP